MLNVGSQKDKMQVMFWQSEFQLIDSKILGKTTLTIP